MNTVTINIAEYMELKNLERIISENKEIINISMSPYGHYSVNKYIGYNTGDFLKQAEERVAQLEKDLYSQKKEISALVNRIKELKRRNLIQRILNK